jgi:hypothetical protein
MAAYLRVSVAAALAVAVGAVMWATGEPAGIADTAAHVAPPAPAAPVKAARADDSSANASVSPTASPFGVLAAGAVVPAAPGVPRRSELNYPRHSGR